MRRPIGPTPLRATTRSARRPVLLTLALVAAAAAGAAELATGPLRAGEVAAEAQLPAPLVELGRHDRVPASPGGYVDVWGPLAPWEARLLEGRRPAGRGGVRAGR
ncbi:MAG: hypothetical protein PVJ89_09350 [Planctomycetota bacterium]